MNILQKVFVSSLFCLCASMFVIPPTVMAQSRLPDLVPVVVNASQGTVEVRNIGDAVARPSQVFVVCSVRRSGQRSTPCASGLHLPGFIEKWNTLPYDIPALQPGAKYLLHLFGSDAFPRRPGVYGINIIIDPRKYIAESNEQNNDVHLGTVIQSATGSLKIVVQDDRHNDIAPFSYFIRKHGDQRNYAGQLAHGEQQTSPLEISLPEGQYDLHVTRQLSFMNPRTRSVHNINQAMSQRLLGNDVQQTIAGIQVKEGLVVEQNVIFKHIEPGFLKLRVRRDGQAAKAHLDIGLPAENNSRILDSYQAMFNSPLQLTLAPGRYVLHVWPLDEKGSSSVQGAGYGSKNVEITIHAGKTVEKILAFVQQEKGTLVLTVQVNGRRSKADVGVRRAGTKDRFNTIITTYNFFNNEADILPGTYDFLIRPLEYHLESLGGVDVFHGGVSGPEIGTRRVQGVEPVVLHNVQIKKGGALKKTVTFTTK